MKYTYNQMVDMLTRGTITVTFEKVDGTTRQMNCTLLPQYLPEDHRQNKPMLTETTPTNIPVWDIDASAWRSFRLDSVREVAAHGC